jgi:HPt (histidine-containing phosphotransfer) domain-containing protein
MAAVATVPDYRAASPELLPRGDQLLRQAKHSGGARALIAGLDDTASPDVVVFGGSRGFDPEVGLRRTGGVRERYRNFVARFIAEHAGDVRLIQDNLAADDRDGARRIAHTLESVAGSLGANALADAAARVSAMLGQNKDADQELARFRQELAATLKDMQALLGSGVPPADSAVAAPVSESEAVRVIGKLATLIAHFDSEAIWFYEKHRQALEQALPAEQMRLLGDSLAHFDYDSAMRALHRANPGEGHDDAAT